MKADELKQLLDSRTAHIGVIGMGHVGLPLAQASVEAGSEAVGFDLIHAPADSLLNGKSPIFSVGRCIEADAMCHDPFVGKRRIDDAVLESVELEVEPANGADAALNVARHTDVNYQSVLDAAPLVNNTGNATDGMSGSAVVVSI